MTRFAFVLLFVALPAAAQYAGPGVDACLAYASKEERQKVVFDRDSQLTLERYTRKVGSQFVSSLLLGNGAIVLPTGAPIEMSFLCLLASDRQAVFFSWVPRRDAPVLAQCRRVAEPGGCFEFLMQHADLELTTLYSRHYLEATQADAKAGNEITSNAFRRSAEAFKAYRDAECARRGGGDATRACVIELTQRRALDLR
jgi:uncharacterized protein YecT (DUF1311 family)